MNDNLLVYATQYMFSVAFVGMAAGSLYFILERKNLAPEMQRLASICAVVPFVACLNYFYMKNMVGITGNVDDVLNFPTAFRYVDWLITTPLLLSMFPYLLGDSEEHFSVMSKLMVADVIMIATGYYGEVSIINASGGTINGWIGYILGCFAWLYIVVTLYGTVAKLAANMSVPVQKSLNTMRLFVVIGWAIYPIGFFVPLLGYGVEFQVVRELLYCIADLVNKVGFGLVAMSAAQTISYELYAQD